MSNCSVMYNKCVNGSCEDYAKRISRNKQESVDQLVLQYGKDYTEYINRLNNIPNSSRPQAEISMLERQYSGRLNRYKEAIANQIKSVENLKMCSDNLIRDNTKKIQKNNNKIRDLKLNVEKMDKHIIDRKTELTSKEKQLYQEDQNKSYRSRILFLLIGFNVFLIITIIFLLKKE